MAFISMPELNGTLSRPTKTALRVAWITLYPVICLVHELVLMKMERDTGYRGRIRGRKPRAITSRWRRRRDLSNRGLRTQNHCSLLALPREVRDEIWRFVMGGSSGVHVWSSFLDNASGLRGVKCGSVCGLCEGNSTGYWISSDDYYEPPVLPFGVMGCLLSCNQIYSEAIGFLYTLSTFKINSGFDIVHLPRLLLPQRINLIRSLNVRWRLLDPPSLPSPQRRSDDLAKMEKAKQKNHHYRKNWVAVWDNLASMEGLVNLKVDVRIGHRRQGCVMRRESQSFLWTASDLQIVKSVTRPINFELFLPTELEQRVINEVTAPNLRILPTIGMLGEPLEDWARFL